MTTPAEQLRAMVAEAVGKLRIEYAIGATGSRCISLAEDAAAARRWALARRRLRQEEGL